MAAPKRSRALPYGAESPQIPQQEAEEVPYHLSGSCCSESPSTSLIITKLLPAEPSGAAWSSATRQAGQHPAPSFSSIRTPEARKLTPLMQHLQGNLFQLPPRLLRPLASPEPMAAIPGQESFGCQWVPGCTFTGGWRAFKLQVSAQFAGQDFVSNQCKARKASVPHNVTCRKKQKTS